MNPGGSTCSPGCMTRLSCWVMPSMTSTARGLPSSSSPAFMPRIRSCQLSRPAASRVPPTLWVTASLMRARFTMHSRKTAACTCWNSLSSPFGALAEASLGRISPTSPSSRRSSTPMSIAAISTSIDSSALTLPSTILARRSVSACTLPRSSPRPSTPRVSPILRSMSTWEASSCGWPAPRRTKMSRTSLTLARSSRIAAATVCMSLMLGAERFSRSCSMLSSTGSSSARRNEARTALTRPPEDSARPT